jgi:hypothetical protein
LLPAVQAFQNTQGFVLGNQVAFACFTADPHTQVFDSVSLIPLAVALDLTAAEMRGDIFSMRIEGQAYYLSAFAALDRDPSSRGSAVRWTDSTRARR